MVPTIRCPNCSVVMPPGQENVNPVCPSCFKSFEVLKFPAFEREIAKPPVLELAAEGESACFFHPKYRASVPCEECGRFLCSLCATDFGRRQLCPECIYSARLGKKAGGLNHQAILYDNLALSLVFLPLIFFYAMVITAPAGVFVSAFYFNRQRTLVPRSRVRFVLAAIIGLIEIAATIFLIIWLVTYLKSKGDLG